MSEKLFIAARDCLREAEPEAKCACTQQTASAMQTLADDFAVAPELIGRLALDLSPGRPQRPQLVTPRELPRRSLADETGRAALLHAIAHIEFNAINLAWDAVCRFPGMPAEYYRNWARVAGEEAYHFTLLHDRLKELGCGYGDFNAHNGLWQMACDTAHDPLVRMALVPRVLEARGLDVTPGMMERLAAAGDQRSVDILSIILRDEIGHVEIGSRWFRYLCEQRGLQAEDTFRELIREYMAYPPKPPFHVQARLQAGFSVDELQQLENWGSPEE